MTELKASDLGINSDKKLKKELSKWQLLFMSFGSIIGSGWLLSPLYTASAVGGYSLLDWIIGGILVLFIALPYAELGSSIPKSGSLVRYPHYSHGGFAGFISSWVYLIPVISSPAIEASASVGYLSSVFHGLSYCGQLTYLGVAVAVALIVFYFFLNYFGIKLLGRITEGIGWWKLIIPFATALFLLVFYFHPSNFSLSFSSYEGYTGFNAILYSIPVTGIIYSYGGFRQAVEYAGETKNPKNVPFALIGALLISLGLYLLLEIAFVGAVNWSYVSTTPGNWTALSSSVYSQGPFYEQIKSIPASGLIYLVLLSLSVILLLDSIISPSGSGWIYVGTSARAVYGISADGYFPSILLKVDKRGIPIFSLILSVIVGSLFLLPFPSWIALIGFLSAIGVFNYITAGIVLQSLRKTGGEIKRFYKLPYAEVLAPLATVSAGLIIYWSGFAYDFYLVVAALLGLPIFFSYYANKFLNLPKLIAIIAAMFNTILVLVPSILFYENTNSLSSPNNLWFFVSLSAFAVTVLFDVLVSMKFLDLTARKEILAGLWIFMYILGLYVISYFGGFGLCILIPFPWDTIVAILLGLSIHYLAVKSSIRTKALDEIVKSIKEAT
ncbi:APC family permease [Acidianus sp. HS-5]|uniref:APC family permease n=1 Tax=Acidianus sp. HS-5 TaxID=2886040 RepID=UPI001F45795F|nr:APC family permease [Acidianus sp. HS-5]